MKNYYNPQEKVYEHLPASIKAICKWHQWIVYDLRKTGCVETFAKYQNMRLWLIETLSSLAVTADMLPVITEKNFYSTWFECDMDLDKDSLLEMKHEFYELKKRYYGFTMVELC